MMPSPTRLSDDKANLLAYNEAVAFAKHGHPVFPCHTVQEGICSCTAGRKCDNPGKHPRIKHGLSDATTDLDTIAQWHEDHDDSNWALVCANVSVADLDPKHGADPATLIEDFQLASYPLVSTGEYQGIVGAHVYCAAGTPTVPQTKCPVVGVEVRGPGAYIMVPGSRHVSGVVYEWGNGKRPWTTNLSSVPPEFAPISDNGHYDSLVIPDGSRNVDLTSLAGKLKYAGMTEAEILDGLRVLSDHRAQPPVEKDSELQAIAHSIAKRDSAVDKQLIRLRSTDEAKRLLKLEKEREDRSLLVLPQPTWSAADDILVRDAEEEYAIAGIAPYGGNTIVVAQYGIGKTELLQNLAGDIADENAFLGEFDISATDGMVAYLNFEMTADMFRDWLNPKGIENLDRILPVHLRGKRFPLWDREWRKAWADYFADRNVQWLLLDPYAAAVHPYVTNLNDNSQVNAYLIELDQFKAEAHIPNLVMNVHMTDRQQFDDWKEHSLGAMRLDAWADAQWFYTKDTDNRHTLRFDKRVAFDVKQTTYDIKFSPTTHRLATTGMSRVERRKEDGVRTMVALLAQVITASDGELPGTEAFKKHWKGNFKENWACFQSAIADGYIVQTKVGAAKACNVTDDGRTLMRKLVIR